MSQDAFTILIADRNPHVREFLRREFLCEGYRVKLAKNGTDVIRAVMGPGPPDVLVLDLDLPDTNGSEILDTLEDNIPGLPVVLHCFAPETETLKGPLLKANAFVEKEGNSVDRLKKIIRALLPFAEKKTGEPAETESSKRRHTEDIKT